MYLSRLYLNSQNRYAIRDSSHRYELHRTLSRACKQGFLWRLELERRLGFPTVLVQSSVAPDWDAVTTEYPGYFSDTITKPYTLPERFFQSQRLNFLLEANPTVKRRGKHHGLVDTAEQLSWMHRQLQRLNAIPVLTHVVRVERLFIRKSSNHEEKPIILIAVTFQGIIQIEAPDLFRQGLTQGIGRGKAFGLGLISVAPSRTHSG